MSLTAIRVGPRPVAVARMGVGLAGAFNAVESHEILLRISHGKLATPTIDGLDLSSEPWLSVLVVVGVVAGIAVAVGVLTSAAAAVSVAASVAVLVTDLQTYSSHRLLATLLMAYLVFAQAGSAWSVQRSAHRASVPWWPQLLMMSQLSVLYLFAGLSKANPVFLTGVPLSHWVWVELPWPVFTLAAFVTVLVEAGIAVGLWFRRTRRFAAVAGVLLHMSIVALMREDSLALVVFAITCLSLYPLFLFRPALVRPPSPEPRPRTNAQGRSPGA